MNASYRLLEAMNGIRGETIAHTERLLYRKEEQTMRKPKNIWRTILIAAVITCFLSVTAFAVSQFRMQGHVSTGEDVFTATFGDQQVEWTSEYVFTFEGPEACQAIEFKADWVPDADYWSFMPPPADGWSTLLEAREIYNEEYGVYMPACVIDVLYAPQFLDGGAMILHGFTPGEITEETWGDVQAYRFEATATHAIDAAQTVFPTGNFVILFHPEQGWIVGVRGYDSMETIEQIARSLQIRQTNQTVHSEDFESNVTFCDIYIG